MKSIRVTLVEDNILHRFLYSNFIKSYPSCTIEIETFENGLEAWEHFNSIKGRPSLFPDLLLLDINMPIMNGWELIENLAVNQFDFIYKTTIYIFSSSSLSLDTNKLYDYEFLDGYIIKPINRQDVYKILDYTLGKNNN